VSRLLRVRREIWPLKRPFAIARGRKTVAEVVVVEIEEEEGRVGRGECVPYARYGESVGGVIETIERLSPAISAGLTRERLQTALAPGAARNAIDCALWDLAAKQSGRRAWELAEISRPQPVQTAQTISLDGADTMAAAAATLTARSGARAGIASTAPLLKVKVGAERVVERVAAVRAAAPLARLIVDANEGWSLATLKTLVGPLYELGVEMIEQPLPAGDDGALARLSAPIVLCADESCHSVADLDRLAGYAMINVKLDKTGGLTAALRLMKEARARRLTVMVGCMVATSLAMAPAMLLSAAAELVDLDGPLWLARDRSPPLRYIDDRIHPPPAVLWG
jgi:L-alanine-DL-glutamate epimerase-like enolase superfamily enzyme